MAPTPTASTSASPAAPGEAGADEGGVPGWFWWLVAAVLAGAALTWFLVARSRARRRWRAELGTAEGDVAWLARELLPSMRRTGTRDRAVGAWDVSRARVVATEDQLTALASSAKEQADGDRARALRDTLRDTRRSMESLGVSDPGGAWILQVDAAIAALEAALDGHD